MSKTTDKTKNLKRGGPSKPFDSGSNQPSSEAKSAGWDRRREAQKIMDQIMLYGDMTVGELKKMIEDGGDDMRVKDRRIAKYLTSDKFIGDWLDRHIAKAPQNIELTGVDGGAIEQRVKIEIVTN